MDRDLGDLSQQDDLRCLETLDGDYTSNTDRFSVRGAVASHDIDSGDGVSEKTAYAPKQEEIEETSTYTGKVEEHPSGRNAGGPAILYCYHGNNIQLCMSRIDPFIIVISNCYPHTSAPPVVLLR